LWKAGLTESTRCRQARKGGNLDQQRTGALPKQWPHNGENKMTDNDAKLITLLENVLEDIMGDLDTEISSHSSMILSNETRFISEQIRHLKGKKNA
jgi:hypothetical protein